MANALHGDAHLVCDACEDIHVNKRVFRVVLLSSKVSQRFEECLRPSNLATPPATRLHPVEKRIIFVVMLQHNLCRRLRAQFTKLGFHKLGAVLQTTVNQAQVALCENVLFHLSLQATLGPPGLSNDHRPISLKVKALEEAPSGDFLVEIHPQHALRKAVPLLHTFCLVGLEHRVLGPLQA
eukprot:CAMPEP_0172813014 /NCGR_PEP_ID=MMETSP1075-20121228/10396_1 /TAXON_ID=2916 /ORGANISM="Ceratium fusus, Strain PA161109" /LENGTH=180 /DNA_ID=CAMNT_0013652647 /DNA_START=617 /DNA_END=1159 /DNA_ORIENTATION=+